MAGKNLFLVLYVLIALLCVAISVYLSYWGYISHLQELTPLFAALIGLLLFGVDMMIRQTLINRRSLILPLLLFGLVLVFSGASNFNFLYNNFMASDIAERAVRDQFEVFRQDLTETQRTLVRQDDVQQFLGQRRQLEAELDNLRQQLGDPLRPGCGERCQGHIDTINTLLGGEPTDLALPAVDARAETQIAWYNNYRRVVLADFAARQQPPAVTGSLQLVDRIRTLLDRYNDPDAILQAQLNEAGSALLRGEGLPVSATLRRESIDVERAANALLPADARVEHTRIESDLDKIGEIPVSFRDGFIDRPNPGVTIISALLAVFVDLIPVLFAIVLAKTAGTGPQHEPPRHERRTRRIAT